MTNEHVLMTQKTFPISMTCADNTGIEKGAVLMISDPDTAATHTASSDVVAGIAYTEKIADNGMTSVSVLSGPGDELKAYASGSIDIGDTLMTADVKFINYLMKATTGLSGGHVIGIAKETAAASETFKYILQIGAGT